MQAIKRIGEYRRNHPTSPDAEILSQLALALANDEPVSLASLYSLKLEAFDLALQLISEWRLDRHYAREEKLLEHVTERA